MANKQCLFTKFAADGPIDSSFFDVKETDLPGEPVDGQIQIKLTNISVDPYMRGRMNKTENYFPSFQPGQPMSGGVTGHVIKSKSDKFKEGQKVTLMGAWVLVQNVDANSVKPLPEGIKESYFIGQLGMPGLSAVLSVQNIFEKGQEENIKKSQQYVFVSGAAGAVGSVVGQYCKSQGYKVIGAAGTDEKIKRLQELGFDETINYKKDNQAEKLKKFAPNGLNLYFDNVGGETLDIALENMANQGTIVSCGMISGYDVPVEKRYGNKNLFYVITKRLKMQGFIVSDWITQFESAGKQLVGLFMGGKLKVDETIVEGFEKIPEAFLGLFKGNNTGKMVVQL